MIQNRLNEQLSRTQTVINVSSHGLGALRDLNLQNAVDIALRTRPTLRWVGRAAAEGRIALGPRARAEPWVA